MWSTSRHALQELFRDFTKVSRSSIQCFSQTTCKNTLVVERWWQVPLSKEGRPPRLYPRRHRVYKVVEDSKHSPTGDMELILTQTVARLGGRGDTIFVKKQMGRNKLLARGMAVYPSPENKEMFAEELRILREGRPEDRIQTRTGEMTLQLLKQMELKVEKNTSVDYEITKEIVCRHFLKRRGTFVPPHALRLPEEPIKDLGDYWCEVTVNGIDTVRIPMSVVPYQDRSASHLKMLKQQQQAAAALSGEALLEAGTVAVPESATAALSQAAVSEAVATAVPESAVSEAVTAVVTEAAITDMVPEAAATAHVPVVSAAPTAPETVSAQEASATPEAAAAAVVLEAAAETVSAQEASATPEAAAAPVLEAAAETVSAQEASATPEAAAAPVLEAAATSEAAVAPKATPEAPATAATPEEAAPKATTEDKAVPSNETQKKD